MSDDDEDQVDSDANLFDGSLEGPDTMGFGPLIPTESERSLMERVRQELKHELKQVMNWMKYCEIILYLQCITHFLLLIGLQGENCRHKRGNSAQEKGRKTSWWHNLCSQILVAITFQVAIPYCKSCHIAPEILIQVLAIKTFHDAYPRLSRRNWKMKQKWKTIVLLIGGKAVF